MNLPAAKRSALPLASAAMLCQPEERRAAAERCEERKRIGRQMEEQLEEQLEDKEIELDDLREQASLSTSGSLTVADCQTD